MIDGHSKPYCFDWNRNGGGVLIHIREDKPSNLLAVHKLLHGIEEIFVELNLRKKKWLIFGSHNPLSQSDDYFFHQVKSLDMYGRFYERFMLIGKFTQVNSESKFITPEFIFKGKGTRTKFNVADDIEFQLSPSGSYRFEHMLKQSVICPTATIHSLKRITRSMYSMIMRFTWSRK